MFDESMASRGKLLKCEEIKRANTRRQSNGKMLKMQEMLLMNPCHNRK